MTDPRDRRRLLAALLAGPCLLPVARTQAAGQRVVALGGGITEIVYALEAGAALVATDTTSIHPAAAQHTRKVGYLRALSAEGVLSLAPTLVLASHDAGPGHVLEQLRSAGVPLLQMAERYDFEGLLERVAIIGGALGRGPQAESLARRLRTDWQQARTAVESSAGRRGGPPIRVVFVLAHANAPVVAGRDTAADALIRLAGGDNPLGGAFSLYKPMTPEALLQARPDLLLTTTQGLQAQGGVDGMLGRPGVQLTPAGRGRRIIGFDALYLLGFGPRLPAAVRELAGVLADTPSA